MPSTDTASQGGSQPSELPRRELLVYRFLGVMATLAIVGLGLLHQAVDVDRVDPFWERALVGTATLAAVGLSFVWRTRSFLLVIYGIFYLITFWVIHLLMLNRLAVDYALSMFIVVAGISSAFRSRRHLGVYLGITVLAAAFATAAVDEPDPSPMNSAIFVTDLGLVCLLLYVAMSSRLRAESDLRRSEERYALAARGSKDGLWDWRLDSDEIYYSPRWEAMLGYEEGEIPPDPSEWLGRVHEADRPALETEIAEARKGPVDHFEVEYRMLNRGGETRWMLARGVAVRGGDGAAKRMAGSQTDVTARKRAEAQLLHDAFHDGLTGLPNRALFIDRVDRLVSLRKRGSTPFAVVFLDLDRFKLVNDSLGHLAGDELLIEVSGRLVSVLREEDTVARLGGDEFAVILVEVEGPEAASRVADRIQAAVRRPVEIEGRETYTSASIGICLSSPEYERAEELLRNADIAMYEAKGAGPGNFAIFDQEMHQAVVRRLDLERDLRRALAEDELFLRYEPIVDVGDGRVHAFEALVRWRHPRKGVLAPAAFIPLAEETGLIAPLGAWVLQRACEEARTWESVVGGGAPPGVNVNLSGIQLREANLVENVREALERSGLDPERLKLEIAENVVMADPELAARMLTDLRELGVGATIDDFGTGHSSLSSLQRFPVEMVKIDREFVRRLDSGTSQLEVVKAVIALARALDLRCVAEGVERDTQLSWLRELGCERVQGFLFPHELTADEAGKLAAYRASQPA